MTLNKYLIHCDFELHPETEKESCSISELEKMFSGEGKGRRICRNKVDYKTSKIQSNYTLSPLIKLTKCQWPISLRLLSNIRRKDINFSYTMKTTFFISEKSNAHSKLILFKASKVTMSQDLSNDWGSCSTGKKNKTHIRGIQWQAHSSSSRSLSGHIDQKLDLIQVSTMTVLLYLSLKSRKAERIIIP